MAKKDERLMLDETTGEMVDRMDNARSAPRDAADVNRARAKATEKGGTVMMSLRVPVEVKAQLADMAKERGMSQTDIVVNAVEDSVGLAKAMAAVSDCLQQNPPPFVPDGWKPSSSECMTFILRAVDDAIKSEEKR